MATRKRAPWGVLLCTLVLGASAPLAVAAESGWPGWLGPARDGKSTDTGLLKEWPPGGPTLLWKAEDIGKGYSSPAVSGGMVYVTGDLDDKLMIFAFDSSGALKWKADCGPVWKGDHPGARSSPTVDAGRVYLLSGKGILTCYDAKTGAKQWTDDMKELGGSPGGWGYAESVLIYHNMLIVTPGGSHAIVALDKTTGQGIWSSSGFSATANYSSCLAFTFENTPMIVQGTGAGLFCLDAGTGNLLWSNSFSKGNTANCPTPAYSDGYIFWANGYGKGGICMKLESGGKAAVAWTTHDMDCHHGGYIIDNGSIYGSNGGGWSCLDLKTGQKNWQSKGVGKGSLCWADGMLYLYSEKDGLCALATCSPQGLEIKGKFNVAGTGPSWAHPVVTGGRLYLRYDANLYCFDVKAR